MNRRVRAAVVLAVASLAVPAAAEETRVAEERWPAFTLSPGLQMWTAVAAEESGQIQDPNLIGGVLKAQYLFAEHMGAHARFAYGANDYDTPSLDRSVTGWAAALGMDVVLAFGRRALWYNTMGVGFQQAEISETGSDHPVMTNVGPYFITTFDVALTSWIGVWMDWGCQVVGPAWAESAAGSVKTWHINPLGAGGFRFSL